MRHALAVLLAVSLLSAVAPVHAGELRIDSFAASAPIELTQRDKLRNTLGHHGSLLIRSKARYDQVLGLFAEQGCVAPATLPPIDFKTDMVALVFDTGDEGNRFINPSASYRDKRIDLALVMTYVIYKKRDVENDTLKFFAVKLPKADMVNVRVITRTESQKPQESRNEYSALLGGEVGEVVDNLAAHIEPAAAQVEAGADIQVKFVIERIETAGAEVGPGGGAFARRFDNITVWDGKYSNGYRNHSFLVTDPAGKTAFLRPKVIGNWDKNIPHPEPVLVGKPYVLPAWREGEVYKSLKDLGLDTSAPGDYTITGVYTEAGALSIRHLEPQLLWGGNIASNTVTVHVTPKAK
jgi:hypothetical protein